MILPLLVVVLILVLIVAIFWALAPQTGSGGWQGMCVLALLTAFVATPSVVAAFAAVGD